MRSSRSTAFALALVAAACGNDVVGPDLELAALCAESDLTYHSFGEPFMLDWCRGCHSAAIPEDMRQGAPPWINLEDVDQVRAHAKKIAIQATGATPMMPPAAGPSDEERILLAEWIACGAP